MLTLLVHLFKIESLSSCLLTKTKMYLWLSYVLWWGKLQVLTFKYLNVSTHSNIWELMAYQTNNSWSHLPPDTIKYTDTHSHLIYQLEQRTFMICFTTRHDTRCHSNWWNTWTCICRLELFFFLVTCTAGRPNTSWDNPGDQNNSTLHKPPTTKLNNATSLCLAFTPDQRSLHKTYITALGAK